MAEQFNGAFAHWWWSHVPVNRLVAFLKVLHGKLVPGASVLFVDQLPSIGEEGRLNVEGDMIVTRHLPDGRSFDVVKNFPTESSVRESLSGIAEGLTYMEFPTEQSWQVSYRTKG